MISHIKLLVLIQINTKYFIGYSTSATTPKSYKHKCGQDFEHKLLQYVKLYFKCGAYGSCNINSSPACRCLDGFEPKIQKDWNAESGLVVVKGK